MHIDQTRLWALLYWFLYARVCIYTAQTNYFQNKKMFRIICDFRPLVVVKMVSHNIKTQDEIFSNVGKENFTKKNFSYVN